MNRAWVAAGVLVALAATGACGDGDNEGGAATPTAFALRPVLATSEPPCPDDSATEGADVLPEIKDGKTEACLQLGPAIVETADVQSAALGRHLGGVSVSVVLGRTGSANLDDFAARSVGKRLAIVVHGKVVRAPAVQTKSFLGRVEVVGLSEDEAEQLLAELDGAPTR